VESVGDGNDGGVEEQDNGGVGEFGTAEAVAAALAYDLTLT
jgi:hypothetical protein